MRAASASILGFIVLLSCYWFGQWFVVTLDLPFPGALVGLVLLLVLLRWRRQTPQSIAIAGQPLLRHMAVLFVPAVLGVVRYWAEITQHLLPLTIAIVVSTTVSLGLAAWLAQRFFRRAGVNE